ncbi:diiron oxygenase [Streptomyces sp. MUM 178J]|uniref:diiron oxygenase n=1 Tax=Streptomyces sp. MUM 178J TaxID=2791991 RepID=UPI001F03C8A0|nr:diiron oxygenase [Streptomyces sp. MUM 178J]WRQ80747.1 diiron oxygenase [Streptomyces sp. MUM 178J]
MCGIIGLFVGCELALACPKQQILNAVSTEDTRPELADESYSSPFRSWYERSSVRSTPRRLIADEDEGKQYFSPELVPVAGHPLVKALPAQVQDHILIQHLYRYLDFTMKLEHLVVNRTVLAIAYNTTGVDVPAQMRLDAHKIYCDEAYHGLFSADLMEQAVRRTGVQPLLPNQPYFLRRLHEIQSQLEPGLRPLAEMLFVIVSETLISATLSQLPDEESLVPAVRQVVQDHAMDEGRHHTYFALFLRHLYSQLSQTQRRAAGLLVPQLIHAFLNPDCSAVQSELMTYGLTRDAAVQVTEETFTPGVVTQFAVDTSRQTVRHFAAVGARDIPEVDEEFLRHGL